VFGRVGAGGAEDGAAAEVDAADVLNRERPEGLPVALDQVAKAIADAEDLNAVVERLDGDRADDAVDAGRRSAADQEGQLVDRARHALPPGPRYLPALL